MGTHVLNCALHHLHLTMLPKLSSRDEILLHITVRRPRSGAGIFSPINKTVQGGAEAGIYRISSQSKAQSSSLRETCPRARRQCLFEGITHINGVMRVKSHVIYTLKGGSNA